MPVLALMRHGQSRWNLENRFTGWWDSDLTPKGEEEACRAGELLAESGLEFSCCWTSLQTRAIRTLWLALSRMGRAWVPVVRDYRLNERHYGGLTGLNKAETTKIHGAEQVHVWRRSYDTPPPPIESGSEYDVSADPRYRGIDTPASESLKMTLARVQPLWQQRIAPDLEAGCNLLISAHGNSLRALVKLIFALSDADIMAIEIPTGVPLIIDLDEDMQLSGVRYLDPSRGTVPPMP